MILRDLIESDIDPLRNIYNFYVRTSTVTFELDEQSYEAMRQRLFEPVEKGYPCIVAEEGGKVLGYCAVHPWHPRYDPTGEVTIYLAPEACGSGLGRAMTGKIIEMVRKIEWLHALIVCISSDNMPSRRLAEEFGFKQVAYYTEVSRKFGKWVDDVDYELLL